VGNHRGEGQIGARLISSWCVTCGGGSSSSSSI